MLRTRWMLITVAVGLATALSSCSSDTGVCTGCCGPSDNTYCKDDWTESECTDFNARQVNGVSWQFYGGQTCAGRGTPATP